ncbi:MAG: hypothetical protein K6U89_13870, partial [Chloroflexi bacterium]|nr:hypothetical protein [Chloroflexota bacterium]
SGAHRGFGVLVAGRLFRQERLVLLMGVDRAVVVDVVRAAQKYLGPGFYTLILTPPGSAAREVGE